MKKTNEIRIRDPFIVTDQVTQTYYLYGTTDENVWEGKGIGFDAYKSNNLEEWEGPFPVFRPEPTFWADQHFWAPEVHFYSEKYYMFASFKSDTKCRGTQILVADQPLGPFVPLTEDPITPREWECLDGTLYIDSNDVPWVIFCHEWLQVKDGEICAQQLSRDLHTTVNQPIILFKASEANWTRGDGHFVTDGPFLYRTQSGNLLMLWSSSGENGYSIGVARSDSGNIAGPWVHESEPLFGKDGGHGMVFRTFDGRLMLTIHQPNQTPNERPIFIPIKEEGNRLIIK